MFVMLPSPPTSVPFTTQELCLRETAPIAASEVQRFPVR